MKGSMICQIVWDVIPVGQEGDDVNGEAGLSAKNNVASNQSSGLWGYLIEMSASLSSLALVAIVPGVMERFGPKLNATQNGNLIRAPSRCVAETFPAVRFSHAASEHEHRLCVYCLHVTNPRLAPAADHVTRQRRDCAP